MFESIKAERKLSFNSWRYRLLHWFFNISPKTPEESTLPHALYRHYCPLFHLTNLIALLLPIILPCKILYVAIKTLLVAINKFCAPILRKMEDMHFALTHKKIQKEQSLEQKKIDLWQDPDFTYNELKKFLVSHLNKFSYDSEILTNFDTFMESEYWRLLRFQGALTEQANIARTRLLYEAIVKVIITKKREAETKKAKRDALILSWVNVSKAIISWLLYVVYACLFVGVSFLLFNYGIPTLIATVHGVMYILGWIFSGDVISTFWWATVWALKIFSGIAIVSLMIWVMIKVGVFNQVKLVITKTFSPVGSAVCACGKFLKETVENMIDFCSMFYAANCPPITITDPDSVETLVDELE